MWGEGRGIREQIASVFVVPFYGRPSFLAQEHISSLLSSKLLIFHREFNKKTHPSCSPWMLLRPVHEFLGEEKYSGRILSHLLSPFTTSFPFTNVHTTVFSLSLETLTVPRICTHAMQLVLVC